MFKKRYLPILIVLLLVISSIAYFGIEKYRIVAVCRDTLAPSDSPFRGDFKYKRIDFLPDRGYRPITVLFDYRGDTAFCHVRRDGSEWKVDEAGLFGISPLPQIVIRKMCARLGEVCLWWHMVSDRTPDEHQRIGTSSTVRFGI